MKRKKDNKLIKVITSVRKIISQSQRYDSLEDFVDHIYRYFHDIDIEILRKEDEKLRKLTRKAVRGE